MEVSHNHIPRNLNEHSEVLLLTGSDLSSQVFLDNVFSQRPLIFTIPIFEDLKIQNDLENKNYIMKKYKNFFIGLRSDFEAFGGDFEKVFMILTSKNSESGLKEYISLVLDDPKNENAPFSKQDEIEILDSLFF